MAEEERHEQKPEAPFGDPQDARWSASPYPAPPQNPYLNQPLGQNSYVQPGHAQPPGYPQIPSPQQGFPVTGYPMVAPAASGVLSIVSMVAGIIGLLTGGFLLVPELVAIICGHLALRREPHMRGLAITGLITGYLGALIFGFVLLLLIVVPIIASTGMP